MIHSDNAHEGLHEFFLNREQLLWAAIKAKHMSTLADLIHDDFVCVSLNGGVFDKPTYLEGIYADLRVLHFEVLSTQVSRVGDCAVSISRVDVEMMYHGLHHREPILCSRTWTRDRGDWRLLGVVATPTRAGDAWSNLRKQQR